MTRSIRGTYKQLGRRGLSLVELVVVMAIIGLLVALLFPALGQSRAAARRIDCMNRLRNVTVSMLTVADTNGRFPACGTFTDVAPFQTRENWVIEVLPGVDQANVVNAWDANASPASAVNLPLTRLNLPVLVCPADISIMPNDDALSYGNLSYVVNGGVGYTTYYNGVHDCPIDWHGTKLDLNGDGISCPSGSKANLDKAIFFQMGLFFNETWKGGVSERYHTLATVTDGLSNTVILSENVRTGYNPAFDGDPDQSSWASSNPKLTSFYIGDPCPGGNCQPGSVDYGLCNRGDSAINAGQFAPEGASPIPNSFHAGGVNMSFGDGRVQFISQNINGRVYAAIVSPQGAGLSGTALTQDGFGSGDY